MSVLLSDSSREIRLPVLGLMIAAAIAVVALPIGAQTPPAAGAVDGTVQKPIPGAGHDYIRMLSETVSPATGALSVRVGLPVPKGRGITPPSVIAYNSGETYSLIEPFGQLEWSTLADNPAGAAVGWGQLGNSPLSITSSEWNFTSPEPPQGYSEIQNCNYATGYSFTDLNGTSHTLGAGAVTLAQNNTNGGQCNSAITITGQSDGQVEGWVASDATQVLANGTEPSAEVIDIYGNTAGAGGMEDRNGNEITDTAWINIGTPQNPIWAPGGTDTAGRPVGLQIPAVAGTYQLYGLSYIVATKTTTINYTPKESLTVEQGASNCNVTGVFPANNATITVISSITLPNLQTYKFYYDPTFGTINEIDFPDGGKVTYTWELSTNSDGSPLYTSVASFPAVQTETGMPMNNACTVQYQTPVVTSRMVEYNGSTPSQYQTFTYGTTWNSTVWTSKNTTVSTTDETTGNSFNTIYTYTPTANDVGAPNNTATFPTVPMEQRVQHFDWGNTSVLDTVTEAWFNQFQKACEVHTLSNNQSYGHFYTWQYGLISDDKEYDFQSGSGLATDCSTPMNGLPYEMPTGTPTRETVTTAFQQFTSPVFHALYEQFAPNFPAPEPTFAKPATVIVKGNGTEIAETDYAYDQFPLQSVSNLTGHDEINLPASVAGGRGNVTTVTKKCLSNGCSGDSVTTYHYDEAGQVIAAIDACGNGTCSDMSASYTNSCYSLSPSSHMTCYYYADEYTSGAPPSGTVSDTYLSQIVYPPTQTTHSESFKWSYQLGELTQSTDENSQTTSYQYNDPLGRLTETDGPPDPNNNNSRAIIQRCYNDTAPNPTTTTSELLNSGSSSQTSCSGSSGTWKNSTAVTDGMGHTVQTELSDPAGTDYVDTIYDGEGRVHQQSNPTRCSSSPGQMPGSCNESSFGITTSYFDALGRNVAVVHPDGTYATNCYNDVASTAASGISIKCYGQIGASAGSWVDSTDENGNTWQRTSDSFGDLLEAVEPNGTSTAPTMQTSYAYDGLSHLLSVVQQGDGSGNRSRYFAYDSQGQLVAAMNPENFGSVNSPGPRSIAPASQSCPHASDGLYTGQWTTCYAYDLNGNLITKTDNRSVSTTYYYDNLNRLRQKTYSDGATLPSNFGYDGYAYDGTLLSGLSNQNGRLSQSSNTLNATSRYSYDVMGRPVLRAERIPGDSTFDVQVNAGYDLAGDIISMSNGSPAQPITFSYGYDNVARLQSLSSDWTPDCNHPATLFSAAAYGPVGLTSATLGGANSGCSTATTNEIAEARNYDTRTRIIAESYNASAIKTSAPTGAISISSPTGEQSKPTGASPGIGSLSIGGTEQSTTVGQTTLYDSGQIDVWINGTLYSAGFGQNFTPSILATSLAQVINSGSLVTATVNGATISLTSNTTGTSTDYSLSTSYTWNSQYFTYSSFTISASGPAMTGGANGSTAYDTGTITATVNGVQASANWGQGSTTISLASALASAIQNVAGSFLNATANGGVVTLTSTSQSYWPVSVSMTDTNSNFSSASFSASAAGMNLGGSIAETAYSYNVGYDGVGNTTSLTDAVMGTWSYNYDTLNRLLTTGQVSSGPYNGQFGCWSYDGFGDRTAQALETSTCPLPANLPVTATYNTSNQVTWTQVNAAVNGFDYDGAGDVTNDNQNEYLYDGAGRICAVENLNTRAMTQYVYDAEGDRVAKGAISTFDCNSTQNGFSLTVQYVIGLGGEQLTELQANNSWSHTNVFAGGALLATYEGTDTYFDLTDWQGTKRVETGAGGCLGTWSSLPFGDSLTGSGNCPDATEHHYTGKIHDAETGNDDFGARYYASPTGRWLSPDWAAAAEAVPYATFSSPQTLNLYAFVGNNPLSHVDPDGHFYRSISVDGDPGATDFSMMMGGGAMGVGADSASPNDGEWNTYQVPVKQSYQTQQVAWSSLSKGQQALVSGGEKSWNGMSVDAQDNFAAITHALEGVKLSGGATGLSEVQSASMRANGREMDVVWKAGATEAFKATGRFWDTHLNPSHLGALILHQSGVGVLGLEMVFPTTISNESQAHIDYLKVGEGHYRTDNDDVAEHKDVYRQLYGPLPGLIP